MDNEPRQETEISQSDDLVSFLDSQVKPWLVEASNSLTTSQRISALNRYNNFELYRKFALDRKDLRVDRDNQLIDVGSSAIVIGLQGDRVLKFSPTFIDALPPRPFDAQLFETGIVESGSLKIGFAIQERLSPIDYHNPENLKTAVAFFTDLRDGKYGDRFVLGDFAAGMHQFGCKYDAEGHVVIKALDRTALLSYDKLMSHFPDFAAASLTEHNQLITELEDLLKNK